MPAIRGLVVAVGEWYAKTLDICLVKNMRHMTECWVVTTPGDPCIDVARKVPGTRIFETTDFYAHGARFNKGLCIERCFDRMGREGWILIWDADVLMPDRLPADRFCDDSVHGARRRILADPALYREDLDWKTLPLRDDYGAIGFFQLFRADAPLIRDERPWYDVTFGHAGGGDAYFLSHFPGGYRPVLPMEVLHLGPPDSNWFGADAAGRAMMRAFAHAHPNWRDGLLANPEPPESPVAVPHRVAVPGFTSDYELNFVRRAGAGAGAGARRESAGSRPV